jgi:diamine N-acetyltransferase
MIKGKNIFLRAPEPSDIDLLYQWENDTETWKVSNTLVPFSRYVLEQYILNSHQDIYASKQLRLMICTHDGWCVGCIDLFDFEPLHGRAGVGVLINGNDRQKGYASEALELVIEYSFRTLNLHQLYCNILTDNEPSLKLFRKNGFEVTGTKKQWIRVNDRWIDEHFLQLVRNE